MPPAALAPAGSQQDAVRKLPFGSTDLPTDSTPAPAPRPPHASSPDTAERQIIQTMEEANAALAAANVDRAKAPAAMAGGLGIDRHQPDTAASRGPAGDGASQMLAVPAAPVVPIATPCNLAANTYAGT